jgi:ferredoxin-thioredoxin reductase catalytic subunit
MTPDEEPVTAEDLTTWASRYASSNGWRLNDDQDKLAVVIRGLLRNKERFGERYCPCRIRSGDSGRDRDIICPCIFHRDEIEQDGQCHCNLFFRK